MSLSTDISTVIEALPDGGHAVILYGSYHPHPYGGEQYAGCAGGDLPAAVEGAVSDTKTSLEEST